MRQGIIVIVSKLWNSYGHDEVELQGSRGNRDCDCDKLVIGIRWSGVVGNDMASQTKE